MTNGPNGAEVIGTEKGGVIRDYSQRRLEYKGGQDSPI